MMRSAVLFLPPYIIMLTNFATSRLPCFGSGSTSRRTAPARRILASAPLGLLGPVLRPALLAPRDARGIERAADDVIANAGKILHAASPDQHDRVLLQIVSDPGNVRRDLEAIGQPDTRDLAERGIRLLRRRGVHTDTHAALLRAGFHGRRLGLLRRRLPPLSHELIDRRHGSSMCSSPSIGPKP